MTPAGSGSAASSSGASPDEAAARTPTPRTPTPRTPAPRRGEGPGGGDAPSPTDPPRTDPPGSAGAEQPREDERSDAELLAVIRGRPADAESTAAFGALWDRHHRAARSLARQLARSGVDADDLVSAAFARLLEVLRAGGGPTEAFRAYLLTSLRHLAYDRTRADRRLDLTDDIGGVIGVDPERTVVPFADPAVAGLERSLAARAFATLPERWQAVLWHLEVEGDSPADVAPLFGLSPNAVSALGYRAREGLRQAYLQEHLASEAAAPPRDRRHRETSERLGAYTRGGLARRDAARVEAHLAECEECRALAGELREVNSGMVRAAVAPTVLGAAVVGYLASRGHPATGDMLVHSTLPTTGELAVAGGGALGVLGTLAGLLRPDLLSPGARAAAAALGVVGIGAATVGVLAAHPAPAELHRPAPPEALSRPHEPAPPAPAGPGAVPAVAPADAGTVDAGPGAVDPGGARPGGSGPTDAGRAETPGGRHAAAGGAHPSGRHAARAGAHHAGAHHTGAHHTGAQHGGSHRPGAHHGGSQPGSGPRHAAARHAAGGSAPVTTTTTTTTWTVDTGTDDPGRGGTATSGRHAGPDAA